jgi:hypothetical protein
MEEKDPKAKVHYYCRESCVMQCNLLRKDPGDVTMAYQWYWDVVYRKELENWNHLE